MLPTEPSGDKIQWNAKAAAGIGLKLVSEGYFWVYAGLLLFIILTCVRHSRTHQIEVV